MNLDDIQKHLDQVIHKQNSQSVAAFEGYSPLEMNHILYEPLGPNSPVSLKKLNSSQCTKSPIFNLMKYFLEQVQIKGEIKLTAKGFLPTKMVKDIYQQGFIEEYAFSSGLSKLYKESDSLSINMTRHLAELAGFTKKRNGKLSLTKSGEKILNDDPKLLELLFNTMTMKFNWGYYDGYEIDTLGQFGFAFSLILLAKYGDKKRQDTFYSSKYLNAFPQLLEDITPTYGTPEKYAQSCYFQRVFDLFLTYFGLVEIEDIGKFYERESWVTKTEQFDQLIHIRPHQK